MPYSSMEQANPALKGIKPPITLAQANAIAAIADKVTGVESPWAVAINQFKESHVAKDGKWVKKEGSEFGGKKKELISGVKAFERDGNMYVWLWTSNAFEDDEQEIFSTKAWDDYVARCDENPKLRGRVWFWHVKGTDYADVIWQGEEGRILLELAEIDNTPFGRKMFHALQHSENYPGVLPHGWGTSHGYVYRSSDKQAGPPDVYNWVHKFESTTLPFHKAANKYGGVKEVIDMSVTKEKAEGLAAVVGDELAAQMLQDAKDAGAKLEQTVAFKETGEELPASKAVAKPVKPVTEEEEEEEAAEEEEEETAAEKKEAGDEFYELEMDDALVKQIAAEVDVKGEVETALKELLPTMLAEAMKMNAANLTQAVKEAVADANVSSKEQIVKDAVAGTLKLKPYTATKDKDNIVPEKDVEVADKGRKPKGDVVSQLAQRMMAGTL